MRRNQLLFSVPEIHLRRDQLQPSHCRARNCNRGNSSSLSEFERAGETCGRYFSLSQGVRASLVRLVRGLDDHGLLHLNQARPSQFLQLFDQRIDLLRSLDELNLERKMVGDFDNATRMDMVIRSETGNALKNRRPGDSIEEQVVENRGISRDPMVSGSF